MTSMMKAPPKFETCLFGPQANPIPITAYQADEVLCNVVSDDEDEDEDENEDCTSASMSNDNGGDNDEADNDNGDVNSAKDSSSHNDVNDDKDAPPIETKGETEPVQDDANSSNDDKDADVDADANTNTDTNDTNGDGSTDTIDRIKDSNESDDTSTNTNTSTPDNSAIIGNNDADIDIGTDIGTDIDIDGISSPSRINSSIASTPPQTPLKATPPPRPAKIISKSNSKTHKKSSTSSSSSNKKKSPPNPPTPSGHTINLQELRRLSSQGVPDECTHRPLAWRVLLGYLPLDTNKWQSTLNRDRLLYRTLVKELFVYGKRHDYPFELEGRKLIGKGLRRDGKKGIIVDVDKVNSWRRNVSGGGGSSVSNGHSHDSSDCNTDHGEGEGVEVSSQDVHSLNQKIYDDKIDKDTEYRQEKESKEDDLSKKDVPPNVREQWRKSGRDPDCLMAGMGKTISGRFVNALLVTNNDTASTKTNDEELNLKLSRSLEGDYDPKWRHFLENASLLDEIRKDVVRTHPDLQFYLEPNNHLGSRRYAAIERILFVWAKLNKGVRYVQGMNEIVGTLYFVLANDENEEWASEAEADTYFLFNTLMVEMRDIFVPDLDEADTGIQGRMTNMINLLSLHDPEVRCHLDDCGIDPGFYSIRWLTTLLSREFLLPDTIRLWDSMFASTHKDNFMRYVCVCMVMVIREDLLKGDFGTCLRLLQAYPPMNVDQLLESSRALWIYESQVTLACHKGGISLSQALSTIAPPPAVIMAYGLHGGLAVEQVGRTRQDMQQLGERKIRNNMRFRKNKNPSANSNSNNNPTSTAAKSLLGFLGLSGMGPNGN